MCVLGISKAGALKFVIRRNISIFIMAQVRTWSNGVTFLSILVLLFTGDLRCLGQVRPHLLSALGLQRSYSALGSLRPLVMFS